MHSVQAMTVWLLISAVGCAAQHATTWVALSRGMQPTVNPSFNVSLDSARRSFDQMDAHPQRLPRPVVMIGGFLDFGRVMQRSAQRLAGAFGDMPMITVSVTSCQSFAACRRRVLDAVNAAWPSDDPDHSIEVDVVGFSLGGLIARDAAGPSADPKDSRQLTMRRLFTISSPHTGAILAQRISLWQFHRDMRPDSAFINRVNAEPRDYELFCYTHLNDEIVGEQHSAPPNVTAWWLADPRYFSVHRSSLSDDRILADIALRLRGETPLSHEPPTTLPAFQPMTPTPAF